MLRSPCCEVRCRPACSPGAESADAAQRLVGPKAARDFGLLPAGRPEGSGQQAAAAPPSELLQAARQLRTEVLKQLLNLFGVGQSEWGQAEGGRG